MSVRSLLVLLGAVLATPAGLGCSGSTTEPNDGLPTTGASSEGGAASRSDAGSHGSATDAGSTPPSPGQDAGSATGVDSGGEPVESGTEPMEGGTAPEAGPTASDVDYAPYFPTWVWGASGYAFTSLVDLQQKAHLNEVTIAFVLSNGGCNTTQDIEQNMADVTAFIAAGGHVKASFGGADGTYLEAKCTTAATWASALEDFVETTGITDLDFDIEQDAVLTDAVNEMRGQALATVQASKNIKVAFTLAANPSPGALTTQGLSVVTHALSAGVKISHVNLMTMDYGDSYGGQPLAPVAIGSLTVASTQLMAAIPGLTKAQAWQMIGVIPMIGQNDDSEVFSVADAKTLATFAIQNQLGLVSFWSIDRDQVCPKGADYNSCSTVDTTNFQFDTIFQSVTAPP
ncbi:MAG: glycosyl hydrolase family 18 protein [Polyangiaceae bacterium]|jgi:chitinase